MTIPEKKADDIAALLEPLPELDGKDFAQSVMRRTKRIQDQRRIIHLLTYVCVMAVSLAALPWQSLISEINNLGHLVALSAGPILQTLSLTEWMQSHLNFREIQAQQSVVVAALVSILAGVIGLVWTEA